MPSLANRALRRAARERVVGAGREVRRARMPDHRRLTARSTAAAMRTRRAPRGRAGSGPPAGPAGPPPRRCPARTLAPPARRTRPPHGQLREHDAELLRRAGDRARGGAPHSVAGGMDHLRPFFGLGRGALEKLLTCPEHLGRGGLIGDEAPRLLDRSTDRPLGDHPDGRVLVVGGGDSGAEAELYDPGSGTPPSFPTTPEPSPSMSPTLVACGNTGTPAGPATGTPGWIRTGSMTTPRTQHDATLLPEGKVLVTGGSGPRRVGVSLAPPLSAELYDPATRSWAATESMSTSRTGHTATLLPDGRVLVTGGYGADRDFASAELYDPASGTWTTTGSMAHERRYHTATLLLDGRVLVAGGFGRRAGPRRAGRGRAVRPTHGDMDRDREHGHAPRLPQGHPAGRWPSAPDRRHQR